MLSVAKFIKSIQDLANTLNFYTLNSHTQHLSYIVHRYQKIDSQPT